MYPHTPITYPQSPASTSVTIPQISNEYISLWTNQGAEFYSPKKKRLNKSSFFYVLLTVHLSIFISVINQLEAKNCYFTISLFHASTCFEHHVLIIRRSKLHYTASDIITLSTCARDGDL